MDTRDRYINSNKLVKIIMGPVGSGKTDASWKAIERNMSENKMSRYIVVRNTRKELIDTTLKSFNNYFKGRARDFPLDSRFRNEFYMVDSSEFIFLAMDNEQSVRQLLCLECTGIYFNEVKDINIDIFLTSIQRIGRFPSFITHGYKPINKSIWADTTPPEIDSPYYNLFENKEDILDRDLIEVFKQPSGLSELAENLENLPSDYYTKIIENLPKEVTDAIVHGNYKIKQ